MSDFYGSESFKYPHLFEPIKLRGQIFRNRIFAAPSGIKNYKDDSMYPEEIFHYYGRKAMGGAASVSTGQYMVDSKIGAVYPEQICTDRPGVINIPMGKLAFMISRYGAVPTMQLSHAGIYANRNSAAIKDGKTYGEAYGPSSFVQADRLVHEMSEEMIYDAIEKFGNAAALAKRCGYGMVQMHAGHGWIFSQFLSPAINHRTDKWGGSIENRARISVLAAQAMRKAVGPNFPIEMRMSGTEAYDLGYDIEDGVAFAKIMQDYVDLIHVSAGNHEVRDAFIIIHPTMFIGEGPNVKYAAEIKKHVKVPVATVGALSEPEMMEDIIASGKADVIEMARGLIADPDLPNKIRAGKEDEIKVCIRCLNCFAHQQSDGVKYCAVNPESGHEHETMHAVRQEAPRKKVLVVGGGIGGMEAALTAEKYEHTVILCEKTGELGGNIRCEREVPFKRRLEMYLNGQVERIKKSSIDLRLNTTVTPEYAKALNPDVIIAALGARPAKPRIPGIDGENVMSAESAYVKPELVGEKVAVLGGGLVGQELALYLAMLGKKPTVLEMMDHMDDGGNPLHVIGLGVQMREYGVEVHFESKAVEINAEGVKYTHNGGELLLEADTVIYAVGQRPLQEEAISLCYCAPEFYMAGDCVRPRNIPAATSVAHDTAINIGRV